MLGKLQDVLMQIQHLPRAFQIQMDFEFKFVRMLFATKFKICEKMLEKYSKRSLLLFQPGTSLAPTSRRRRKSRVLIKRQHVARKRAGNEFVFKNTMKRFS